MRTLNLVAKTYTYDVPSIECRALKLGTLGNAYVANKIISGYVKSGRLGVAHQLFHEMSQRYTISWNTLISEYVRSGCFGPTWDLFTHMRRRGFGNGELICGEQLHSVAIKVGCQSNIYAASSLLDMYAKCGRIGDAYTVFKMMPERNSVSCNAVIAGFVEQTDLGTAFELFKCMGKAGMEIQDGTVAPLLTLLNDPDHLKLTVQMHSKIIIHGLSDNHTVCNALLTSYSECGSLEHAELGLEPDIYSYTSVISACFEEAYQVQGKCFHCLIIKREFERSTAIVNALIAMYMKWSAKSWRMH